MRSFFLSFIICFLIFALINIPVFAQKHPIDKKPVIIIDPGHGGIDPGKVSTTGEEEKNINLEIAFYLKSYLQAQSYTVYMTRETDKGLYLESASNKKTSDLNNRIQFMKQYNADCFISIHQNSYPDPSVFGAQVFYKNGEIESERLATHIQDTLFHINPENHRSCKGSNDYFLLKNATIPAVIVECGFLSNSEEAGKLTDASYQKQLAYYICLGICKYFS